MCIPSDNAHISEIFPLTFMVDGADQVSSGLYSSHVFASQLNE